MRGLSRGANRVMPRGWLASNRPREVRGRSGRVRRRRNVNRLGRRVKGYRLGFPVDRATAGQQRSRGDDGLTAGAMPSASEQADQDLSRSMVPEGGSGVV